MLSNRNSSPNLARSWQLSGKSNMAVGWSLVRHAVRLKHERWSHGVFARCASPGASSTRSACPSIGASRARVQAASQTIWRIWYWSRMSASKRPRRLLVIYVQAVFREGDEEWRLNEQKTQKG